MVVVVVVPPWPRGPPRPPPPPPSPPKLDGNLAPDLARELLRRLRPPDLDSRSFNFLKGAWRRGPVLESLCHVRPLTPGSPPVPTPTTDPQTARKGLRHLSASRTERPPPSQVAGQQRASSLSAPAPSSPGTSPVPPGRTRPLRHGPPVPTRPGDADSRSPEAERWDTDGAVPSLAPRP